MGAFEHKGTNKTDSCDTVAHRYSLVDDFNSVFLPGLAGTIADACKSAANVVNNCSKLGKLRSIIWCKQVSAEFSTAANNLSAGIMSLVRGAPKVIPGTAQLINKKKSKRRISLWISIADIQYFALCCTKQ